MNQEFAETSRGACDSPTLAGGSHGTGQGRLHLQMRKRGLGKSSDLPEAEACRPQMPESGSGCLAPELHAAHCTTLPRLLLVMLRSGAFPPLLGKHLSRSASVSSSVTWGRRSTQDLV